MFLIHRYFSDQSENQNWDIISLSLSCTHIHRHISSCFVLMLLFHVDVPLMMAHIFRFSECAINKFCGSTESNQKDIGLHPNNKKRQQTPHSNEIFLRRLWSAILTTTYFEFAWFVRSSVVIVVVVCLRSEWTQCGWTLAKTDRQPRPPPATISWFRRILTIMKPQENPCSKGSQLVRWCCCYKPLFDAGVVAHSIARNQSPATRYGVGSISLRLLSGISHLPSCLSDWQARCLPLLSILIPWPCECFLKGNLASLQTNFCWLLKPQKLYAWHLEM